MRTPKKNDEPDWNKTPVRDWMEIREIFRQNKTPQLVTVTSPLLLNTILYKLTTLSIRYLNLVLMLCFIEIDRLWVYFSDVPLGQNIGKCTDHSRWCVTLPIFNRIQHAYKKLSNQCINSAVKFRFVAIWCLWAYIGAEGQAQHHNLLSPSLHYYEPPTKRCPI